MCQRPLTTVFKIKDFFVHCVERIVLTITRPGRTVLHYICFDLVLTTKVFFLIKLVQVDHVTFVDKYKYDQTTGCCHY